MSFVFIMQRVRKEMIVVVSAALLVLLFTYTAVSKIANFNLFKFQVSKSELLRPYTEVIAIGVPVAELIAAGMLLALKTRLAGLYASAGMLTAFTVYLLYALVLYDKMPCKCGGVLQDLSWQAHTWFNLFFIATAVAGILASRKTHLQGKAQMF
jgi:hypothetical protein